jgi:hypothetical protein
MFVVKSIPSAPHCHPPGRTRFLFLGDALFGSGFGSDGFIWRGSFINTFRVGNPIYFPPSRPETFNPWSWIQN